MVSSQNPSDLRFRPAAVCEASNLKTVTLRAWHQNFDLRSQADDTRAGAQRFYSLADAVRIGIAARLTSFMDGSQAVPLVNALRPFIEAAVAGAASATALLDGMMAASPIAAARWNASLRNWHLDYHPTIQVFARSLADSGPAEERVRLDLVTIDVAHAFRETWFRLSEAGPGEDTP